VTVLTADGAIQLGMTISKLVLISCPSSGLRRYTSEMIREGAQKQNRTYLHIDAQHYASTPLRWSQHIRNLLNLPESSGTSLDHLEQSLQLPENTVVFIDNAEDFLLLNRYPGCAQFIEKFDTQSKSGDQAWILAGKSPDRFTRHFNTPIRTIQAWNHSQIETYFESHGYYVRESQLDWIVSKSSAFPEYLRPLGHIAVNQPDVDSFIRQIQSELRNPDSPLFLVCKLNWREILHQARGYCSLKGILTTVALHPNCRLSDLARQLSNSAPAVKDYLKSLMGVGAIRRTGWTYALQDPVMAMWLMENHTAFPEPIPRSEETTNDSYLPLRLNRDDSFLEFD
jgi:hypothetical protein